MTIIKLNRGKPKSVTSSLVREMLFGYSANAHSMPGSLGLDYKNVPWEAPTPGQRILTAGGYAHDLAGPGSAISNGAVRTVSPIDWGTSTNTATICIWIGAMPTTPEYFVFNGDVNSYPWLLSQVSWLSSTWYDGGGNGRSHNIDHSLLPGVTGPSVDLLTLAYRSNNLQIYWNGQFAETVGRQGWGGNPGAPAGERIQVCVSTSDENQFTGPVYDWYLFDRDLSVPEIRALYSLGPGGIFKRRSSYFIPLSTGPVTYTGGVNFRNNNNPPYQDIEGPDDVPALSDDTNYPNNKFNLNGEGVTYGWNNVTQVNEFNVDSSPPSPELAGAHGVAHDSGNIFRLDLPAPGTYDIDAAFGAQSVGVRTGYEVRDGDGIVISTINNGPDGADNWRDATNQLHTSGANWVNNRSLLRHTFTNSYVTIRPRPDADPGGDHFVAHLSVSEIILPPATELPVDNAVSSHVANLPNLSWTWVVQNTQHSHVAEQYTFVEIKFLIVQGTEHTHEAAEYQFTQNIVYPVLNAQHTHEAQDVGIDVNIPLTVDGTEHSHEAEAYSLDFVHVLDIDGTEHAHQAEQYQFTQNITYSVLNSQHSHVATLTALFQGEAFPIDNAQHSHLAEEYLLDTLTELLVQNANHTHAAEQYAFFTIDNLAVANAQHTHLAEQTGMFMGLAFVPDNAQHTHLAEQVALDTIIILSIDNAQSGHLAELVSFVEIVEFTIFNAQHGHLAEEAGTVEGVGIIPLGAIHTHQAQLVPMIEQIVEQESGVKWDELILRPNVRYSGTVLRPNVRYN